MDDPGLPSDRHRQALRGLGRVNRVSLAARNLVGPLLEIARSASGRRLRILDLACGGGDVVIALSLRLAAAGVDARVDGCDLSPRAVAFAREASGGAEVESRFFTLDVINGRLPDDYDVLLASLFLHHLPGHQACDLLRRMAGASKLGLLASDLERSAVGYVAAFLGTRALTRSPVVHRDGLRSVRAAFSRSEFARLSREAGLVGFSLRRRWPFRLLLSWRKR